MKQKSGARSQNPEYEEVSSAWFGNIIFWCAMMAAPRTKHYLSLLSPIHRLSLLWKKSAGAREIIYRYEQIAAGRHRISWDGRDQHSRPVVAGLYLVRLSTRHSVQTRKLLIVK